MLEFLEFRVPWISNKHTIMTVLSFLKPPNKWLKSLNYQLNSINSSWTIQYQKFTTKLKKRIIMVLFSPCKKTTNTFKTRLWGGPKGTNMTIKQPSKESWATLRSSLSSATVQCPVGKLENVQHFESRFQPWICGVGPRLVWNWISAQALPEF